MPPEKIFNKSSQFSEHYLDIPILATWFLRGKLDRIYSLSRIADSCNVGLVSVQNSMELMVLEQKVSWFSILVAYCLMTELQRILTINSISFFSYIKTASSSLVTQTYRMFIRDFSYGHSIFFVFWVILLDKAMYLWYNIVRANLYLWYRLTIRVSVSTNRR